MRFSTFLTLSVSALHQFTQAGPIVKRASASEAASVGYATLNGGTKGGAGGSTVTVTTASALQAAVNGNTATIVIVSGTISGAQQIKVGSNKSIIGKDSNAKLIGVGFYVSGVSNVIIRNLAISKVLAANGDAIGIQKSSNVWVDHCDLSSDQSHGKDYYDGLLDITHASEWVTVTNNLLHDHYKASLVGHSDSNGGEDTGHLHVTYANNYFKNLNSRGPSLRFGTGHIFNNYYENMPDGINTRQGAQLLVESNVFSGSSKPLYSTNSGYAVSVDNDFGGASNTAPAGTLESVPYSYNKLSSGSVKAAVVSGAGVKLSF